MTEQLMNEAYAEAERIEKEMLNARGTYLEDLAAAYEIYASNYLSFREQFIAEETQGE